MKKLLINTAVSFNILASVHLGCYRKFGVFFVSPLKNSQLSCKYLNPHPVVASINSFMVSLFLIISDLHFSNLFIASNTSQKTIV